MGAAIAIFMLGGTGMPAQPEQLFGPEAVLVMRIDLEHCTPQRAEQAVRVIFSDEEKREKYGSSIVEGFASFDSTAFAPLRAAGIDTLLAVGSLASGSMSPDLAWCIALPGPAEELPQQAERLAATAAPLGLSASQMGGWLVLRKQGATVSDDLGVLVNDAPFLEAIEEARYRDIVVAFVPSPALRRQMLNMFEGSVSEEPTGDQATLRAFRPALEAEWFVLSIQLSSSPAIVIRFRSGSAAIAGSLRASLANWRSQVSSMIRAGAQEFRKKARERYEEATRRAQEEIREGHDVPLPEPDPDMDFDESPILRMVDTLVVDQEGNRIVLNLTTGEMRDIVDGGLVFAELIAKGLVNAFFGGQTPTPDRGNSP